MKKYRNRLTKEEIQTIKKKNQNIIEKVNLWQNFKYVKPLTCKERSCDGLLEPKESRLRVILKCPKCGNIQSYVPKTILKAKIGYPKVLTDNQNRQKH